MMQLLTLASIVLSVLPVGSVPLKAGENDPRLLGSSFGRPMNATYDYVVVGGGTAGLTVAARLAEDSSVTVAVVEAGGFYEIQNGNISQVPAFDTYWSGKSPNDVSSVDWGFVTSPQKGMLNSTMHYARGKALGGSSARNFMAYNRGTKGSYDKWAEQVGDESYTFESFLPYFQKSVNFTPPKSSRAANATPSYDLDAIGSENGPVSLTFANYAYAMSSWLEKGLAAIGIMPTQGFTGGELNGSAYVLEAINAADQTRESSETAFLQPALKYKSLTVYQSTMAKRILFDSSKTATGVVVESKDSTGLPYVLSANKEVIVSAGAFQSPQLLMVSGVGPAASLKKHNISVVENLPGVGQNMWDHVLAGPSYRVNAITASALSNPETLYKANDLFIQKQEGLLTNPGTDMVAWEKIPDSYRARWSNQTKSALTVFPEDWPEIEYLTLNAYMGYQRNYMKGAPADEYQYASLALALVSPLSRGTIDISSPDMSDPPLINPNFLTHPADQAVILAGYKRAREVFKSPVMADILIGPEYFPGEHVKTDAQLMEVIRESANTVFHASCTCAMGRENDPMAVLDSKARVYGVKGLRVVDASSFPLLPPGHPTATVYALAEKIAADIQRT